MIFKAPPGNTLLPVGHVTVGYRYRLLNRRVQLRVDGELIYVEIRRLLSCEAASQSVLRRVPLGEEASIVSGPFLVGRILHTRLLLTLETLGCLALFADQLLVWDKAAIPKTTLLHAPNPTV